MDHQGYLVEVVAVNAGSGGSTAGGLVELVALVVEKWPPMLSHEPCVRYRERCNLLQIFDTSHHYAVADSRRFRVGTSHKP